MFAVNETLVMVFPDHVLIPSPLTACIALNKKSY